MEEGRGGKIIIYIEQVFHAGAPEVLLVPVPRPSRVPVVAGGGVVVLLAVDDYVVEVLQGPGPEAGGYRAGAGGLTVGPPHEVNGRHGHDPAGEGLQRSGGRGRREDVPVQGSEEVVVPLGLVMVEVLVRGGGVELGRS